MARPLHLSPRSKFFAKPIRVDGIRFASKAEARRYQQLKILVKVGEITQLECQPVFPLYVVNKATGEVIKVGSYRGDFRYQSGEVTVTEDVKSPPTRTTLYRLKKRMVEAQYNIKITEVS